MNDGYGTCRSCPARIRWVRTDAGRAMPLDPEPVKDGNFVFKHPTLESGDVRALSAVERDEPATRPRYKSHFATCPNAGRHKKAGR